MIVRVDETGDNKSIEEMNGSYDHSVRCAAATVEIKVPEGYKGGYTPAEGGEAVTAPTGELTLDYIRGRGHSTWRESAKKPYKIHLHDSPTHFSSFCLSFLPGMNRGQHPHILMRIPSSDEYCN